MAVKQIFFDIADTLLYKPELPAVIQGILAERDVLVPVTSIAYAHRCTRELIPVPPKTGRDFYLRFNADFLRVLGVLPDQGLCEEIYLRCRGLSWAPFDDVSVLDGIAMDIGVISNWDTTLKERLKEHFKTPFAPVVVSAECGVSKPDAGIYRTAIEMSGYAPHEIIHVGDSIRLDIVPALAAGIRAILLDRAGLYEYYDGEKITALSQLVDIIEKDKVMP